MLFQTKKRLIPTLFYNGTFIINDQFNQFLNLKLNLSLIKGNMVVQISLIVIALAFFSCANSGGSALSDADKAAIAKASTDINEAFNKTKDFKAYVEAYYADDATVLYPKQEYLSFHTQ
jgi:hypothetical protein